MREFPRGGLIGRTVHLVRAVNRLHVPIYAANACYFMVMAVFPALLLLLGLLRYTGLEVERLGEMLLGVLPEAFLESAEELILLTYDNTSGTAVGFSALTVVWSASRGIYGLLIGLNAIYGVAENRGWFFTRSISVVYTFAFLIVLLLTLALHVFGTGLIGFLQTATDPVLRFLTEVIDLRFFLLLAVQTAIFTAMFVVLPNKPNRFWDSLPGALLASSGWLIFSDLYSVYVERFAHLSNIYGSVYAIALSMLWLYCCISIVFYGGALNVLLVKLRKKR